MSKRKWEIFSRRRISWNIKNFGLITLKIWVENLDLKNETRRNELMSRKHKKVYTTLNYVEHIFILGSTIIWCISISAFAPSIGIPIGITSSVIELNI